MRCPHCNRKISIIKQKDGDLILWKGCLHLIGVHLPTMEPVFKQPKKCSFDNESGFTSCES